jgi:MFS family permease
MSVQIGFVAGALVSALLNLADRVSARWLLAISALLAGIATALIPILAQGLAIALVLRFFTGFFLAGVYPVGMKIMATWTGADRGLGIGLLVGALTLGSAGPHLLKFLGGLEQWQPVLLMAAGSAILGGLLGVALVSEGPYRSSAPKFNWKYVGEIFRDKEIVLANIGYLGHMWELYAMWAWISVFLEASFEKSGTDVKWASLAGFAVIGIGIVSSIWAGKMADKVGRTTITMLALVVSGLCSLVVGRLFGGSPLLLVGLCLIWGLSVIADSAQFSASVSELCDPKYTGTALTVQTSLGFLLTMVTIRLIPSLVAWVGWEWAFAFLAIGPVVGFAAMGLLRRSPESSRLAGGNR